ncbi:unnamed protein product, partial [Vitis vinifera]
MATQADGIDRSNTLIENSLKNNGHMGRDVEISGTNDGQEGRDTGVFKTNGFSKVGTDISYDNEKDAIIWEPPEPEDDMECSMANSDDDDEFGDGTKWGEPSSLCSFGEEGSGSYKFRDEKQKAMEEVINGKFKTLVNQLLKSVGVASSGKDGESWVDIVTSLSWEAASFVKPDAIEGKAMDPDGYVKVKCIAAGSRNQSQVIKGLVFKKHAAHKHMQTRYKNPRLLLIQGMLGHSSSGLSSFNSMDQEKGNLNSVREMIDVCRPNVVLVEKTVSRDVQETFLEKGLKHCDSFHFEKFVEEHASVGEGGKKPSKTLMFIEGCPTRQGCTILLKGTHSEELKRVKCVMQCAVVMAYHLILETSFLVDQKAMISTIPFDGLANLAPTNPQFPVVGSGNSSASCLEEPIAKDDALRLIVLSGLSSLSASIKKVIGDNFPIIMTSVPVLKSPEAFENCDMEAKSGSDEEKSHDSKRPLSPLACSDVPLNDVKSGGKNEDQMQSKDDISTVLDSQSILVLMSSRNASKGRICEQSHFSHIKFYRNFDVPLGKFLQDNLLNQKHQCPTCGELPEAHFYYYAHCNKQLTIQVKQLPTKSCLPGEAEGKLWMWSRCGKCKPENGITQCTKRVLISTAARGLSFGKFLELSFSQLSSPSRVSSCGHFFHRDFLYFFGLGPMVAVLRYSPVSTYAVDVPPHKLEFSNSIRQESLKKEMENVYMKAISLFTEVANALKKIASRFAGSTLNLGGSLKEFSDVEEMLSQERYEFEVNIQKAIVRNGKPEQAIYKLLSLNRLLWELQLESCLWDRRLHALLSPDSSVVGTSFYNSGNVKTKLETRDQGNELSIREIPVEDASQRSSSHPLACNLEKAKGWIWSPFPEIRRDCMKDLQGGYLPKFESISSYTPEYLPSAYQLIIEEGSRLHIPLGTDDYIVSDYEGELSSIISCALAFLNRITSMPSSHWHSNGSVDSDGSVSSEESLFSSFDGFNLLDSLVSYGAIHPEVSLGVAKSPGKGKYSVVCLYANQFRNLRDQCCPSELDYIASLSRCRNWDAKGGKSKSFFAKTLDDRFIIKEIKKTEFESFMKFAPDYFAYMNHSFTSGSQTCLAKILGIYQVIIRQTKSGKEMRHDLMVMENLTFCRSITRQYDLKGALHARYNSAADGPEDVLLDQNFVNDMNTSPVYVSRKAKRVLQRAVWNDTTFLNSINVMDYSLLVGVDTQRHELVCGIIDYLRQYTWDKQLETWVKSSLVVPKNVLPTVISPKEYKKRFRKFMSTYFFSVPDHWCSQRSSNPCELCGIREDESSSQLKAQKQGEQNGFSA